MQMEMVQMKIVKNLVALFSIVVIGLACGGHKTQGSYADTAGRINDATDVLQSIFSIQEKSIPQAVIRDAKGIAVIPGVVRGSGFLGSKKDMGVMSVRINDSCWSYPSFITIENHNIGWQLGVEEVDLVLIFKTDSSIQKTLQNNLTLGGTVSAAAGPIGRYGSASTNSQLNSQIYSYARAKGLFVGATLNGSVFRIDNADNATFYGVKYINPKDIFQNKVPPQTNFKIVNEFDNELERISKWAANDSSSNQ
jgi:lipid-binding SYLF domain-containing protein